MALKRWAATVTSGTVDTDIELISAAAGEETVIFSMLISNFGTATANIEVTHTDTDGVTPIFEWVLSKALNESPTVIDTPIVLEPGDKILLSADIGGVSALLSGEAK